MGPPLCAGISVGLRGWKLQGICVGHGGGGGEGSCLRSSVEHVSVFSLIWDVRGLFEPKCLPSVSLDLSKLSALGLGLQGSKTLINL